MIDSTILLVLTNLQNRKFQFKKLKIKFKKIKKLLLQHLFAEILSITQNIKFLRFTRNFAIRYLPEFALLSL